MLNYAKQAECHALPWCRTLPPGYTMYWEIFQQLKKMSYLLAALHETIGAVFVLLIILDFVN